MSDPRTADEFEEAIFNAPDDVENYLVYSDWLQSRSDPRGELIALQAEDARVHANSHRGAERSARIAELLHQHHAELIGWHSAWADAFVDASTDVVQHHWYCGFVDRLSVQLPEHWYGDDVTMQMPSDWGRMGEHDLISAVLRVPLDTLLGHPSIRFVRELTLGSRYSENYGYGAAPQFIDDCNKVLIAAMQRAGAKPVRSLRLGDFSQREVARSHFGSLAGLWPIYPRLERLIVRGNCHLGERIPLLSLRHLELWLHERDFGMEPHFGNPGGQERDERRELLSLVTSSFLPELSTLTLEFGTRHPDVSEDLVTLAPVLEGRTFPKLRHLGLRRHHGEDSGVFMELLASAPITRQLDHLDLSDNDLEDDDVELVLAQPERFSHLQTLDLRENRLSDEMVEDLTRIPSVRAAGQRIYDDWL